MLYILLYTGSNDIVLLQYNSAGSLMWTRQTGTASSDMGYGVSASPNGNYIYVTGTAGASLNGQPHAGNKYLYYKFVLTYFSAV